MPEFAERPRLSEVPASAARRGLVLNSGQAPELILPHDAKAESSVLAAMITSEDVLHECLIELKREDFYLERNRIVFEALDALSARSYPTDPISLVSHLKSQGTLERAGGASYVNDLANQLFSLVSWKHHAELVKRDSLLRSMMVAAANITALAADAPEDPKEVVDAAEELLFKATENNVSDATISVGDAMIKLYEDIQTRREAGGSLLGITTGYERLDETLMGLRGGQLIVVGARPAVGKTSFALNLAVEAANPDKPDAQASVLIFSLEMSSLEIAQRLLSSASNVSHSSIAKGQISSSEWPVLTSASQHLSRLDIAIDDTPGTSVTEIRAKARRHFRNKNRGLVIVDYLQLLTSGKRYSDNRANEVAEMSRGLKIMAKDLDVPVIALSQLNRQSANATPRRPQLYDLRESGAIEQDADVVILMDKSNSPEEAEKPDRPDKNMTDFIIAKNRSGPTNIITMGFLDRITKFFEIDHRHEE